MARCVVVCVCVCVRARVCVCTCECNVYVALMVSGGTRLLAILGGPNTAAGSHPPDPQRVDGVSAGVQVGERHAQSLV